MSSKKSGSKKTSTANDRQPVAQKNQKIVDPYPADILCDKISRAFLWAMVIIFPLYMNDSKYSAITKCKGTTFSVFFVITAIITVVVLALFLMTRESKPKPLTRERLMRPPFIADAAIIAYWILMFVSCLLAQDPQLAFVGLDPRNNGFLFQTMYVLTYFIISRGLQPKKTDALVFAWGGAALSFASLMHFFGHDLYNVQSVVGAAYAGPFYNDDKYRFMGPMGNVNLGSYIIAVAVIIAAGLFISGVSLKFDKFNLITLFCFAITLFAELNINTDAGIVALAAAFIALPIFLCTDLIKLRRTFVIYGTAAGVLLFDRWLVDSVLCGEHFGKKGILYAAALCAMLIAAVVTEFLSREHTVRTSVLRGCVCTFAALAIIGAIGISLYVTAPTDVTPAGSVAGAVMAVDQVQYADQTDTMVHELGQMLRGNFDDSFGHNRLFTWKRTLRLVKLHPIFGIGPDNFKSFFASYFHDEAVKQFPDSGGGLDKAHNEFLDILIDNGIVGLLAFLTFIGSLVYYAFRSKKGGIAAVFGVAVIGYAAHAFFGYQLPVQSPAMWIMLGCAAAWIRTEYPEAAEAEDK